MKKSVLNKLLTILLCLTMIFVNVITPKVIIADDEEINNEEASSETIDVPEENNETENIIEEEPVLEEENLNYINYVNQNNLEALLVHGDFTNKSLELDNELEKEYSFDENKISKINNRLFDDLKEEKNKLEGKEDEKDGVKIENFSIEYVNTKENSLTINEDTKEVLLQINYALSLDKELNKGNVIISIPDNLLKDDKANIVGEIVLPYQESSKSDAFVVKHEANEFILYNNISLTSNARGYFEVLIKNIDSNKLKEESILSSTIEVVLEDDVIGLKSNDLSLNVLKETFDEKENNEKDLSDSELLNEEEFEVLKEAIDEKYLAMNNLSLATRKMLGNLKAAPTPQTPVTADHITIEKITIRWVSASSGKEESAMYDDLNLVPTNDIVPNQQWQLDVAFSGKDEILAGDIEIVLPAYIWLDRDGNEPGIVTVAVPREGEPGNYDFAWKRVGDNIVITNTKNLSAASKYMVQGTFRMTSPDPNSDPENFTSTFAHQMVDGNNGITDYKSNPLFAIVNVTTPNTQEVISMTSNEIFATIDTHVEVANASKTSYDKYSKRYNVFYDYQKADIPQELLPDNPEDYLYIKWYVDGRATGNQPFTMISEDVVDDIIYKVEGTTEIPIQAKGIMLGATNTFEGTIKSNDGETIKATLYDGYSDDDKSAYIWTAYKKSYFEGKDASFKVYNTQKVTVIGKDDQIETSTEATSSVAIRLPIVWTIKKEWIYNEDKYDTPLDVIKSRQPETLNVWLDNESTGKEKVFTAVLSDENNWTVEYEDDGVVADYEAYEHSYSVTRHMHGENGTSENIVSGESERVYTDDGKWYYTYWGYDHKSTKYDEETHTWTFVNDYHEGVIGGGYDNFEVEKKATNHRDSNQKSTSDKDLNLLRNDKETTLINYDVHTGTFCLGATSEAGARSWETDKHGKRYVTLELHDYGEYFESRELRNDEFRMATVTMKLPEIYKWVPAQEGSEEGEWQLSDPVPVSLYARGGDETEWTLYALMNIDGTINTYNGASVSGTTVNLPEGKNETLERIRTNGARAYLDYNVGVILFPSEDIKEKIEEIFESTDYAKAHSFNYVTGRLLDDDGNILGELERYDRTYLHGIERRLAVDLDKKTTFINNDKIKKQFIFKNEITLNQQSNVINKDEFEDAFDDYDLPGSKSGTFYDLLPEGMLVDTESIQINNGTAKMVDVIEDYKGTGRQLLIVKADVYKNIISRDYKTRDVKRNDDSYPNITDINSSDKLYGTNATLTFNSTYSFDEAKNRGITNMRNTAAYEADEDIFGNNPEWCGEKDGPTGERHKESLTEVEDYLRVAMTNLDNKKDNPNFVYAGDTYRMTEADFDGLSSLRKYVQAAGDDVDYWVDGLDNSVYVYEGGKYNYKIILTSETDTLTKDIILIDSIEYYTPMEITDKGDSEFKDSQIVSKRELDHVNANLEKAGKTPASAEEVWHWKGCFKSVDVNQMREMGVDVVVYYSTVPDLDITHDEYNPGGYSKEAVPAKLADTTVWSTELPSDPSKVTAVAFDCRKAIDGTDFELHSQESLIAYMHMQSPTWSQQPEAFGDTDYNNPLNNAWAYNNIYMDITQTDEDGMAQETHSYDHYDYTKVGIWTLDVEVQKVWEDKNDNDRVRPESVEVHLIKEGVDTGRSLTLDESNNWYGKFDHVLMYDEDGNRIYYTLNEEPVDEYTSRVEYDSQNMILINTRETEKVDIPFTKKWDSQQADGWQTNIPKTIKVRLYADGVYTGQMKTVRADDRGNWHGQFTGLDKYKDGVEVVYTIEEDSVENFITNIDQDNKVITNTYYPFGDLTVEKNVINGTDKALEKEFTYTLTLKDEDGESIPNQFDYVIVDENDEEISNGKIGNGGEFTLKDKQKIIVKDINSGIKYEVKEKAKAGFTLTGQIASTGTISSNKPRESKFENTYHSYGSAEFNLEKTLLGREIERYQFRFEIVDEEGKTIRLGSNKADGSVSFGAINYTEADNGKTYIYQIKEVDRGKQGYIYDKTVFTAEVSPVDNGDGTMNVTVVYKKDGNVIEKVEFENKYEAKGELEFKAWKSLIGRELKDDEFTFELKDQEGNVITATNKADGTITFNPIEFNQDDIGKEYDFIMSEVNGTDNTVNYSKEQYLFHVAVADNGDGTLSFTQEVRGYNLSLVYLMGEDAKNAQAHLGDNWYIMSGETGIEHGRPYVIIYVRDYTEQGTNDDFILSVIMDIAEYGSIESNYYSDVCSTAIEEWDDRVKNAPDAVTYDTPNAEIYVVPGYELDYAMTLGFIFDIKAEPSDEFKIPVFTNDLKDGELKVSKFTDGGDPEQIFKFRLELDGVDPDKEFPYEFNNERPKYVTLTYNGNGGYFLDNSEVTEQLQRYKDNGSGIYELDDNEVENPTRPSYHFSDWYLDQELTNKWDGNVTEDTTVYAKWIKDSVTVNFVTNCSSSISPQTFDGGNTATKPNDPKNGVIKFLGWYTDEECTKPFDFNTPVEDDLTLYAKWESTATINQKIWSPAIPSHSYGYLPDEYKETKYFSRNTTLTKEEVLALDAEKVDDNTTTYSIYRWVDGEVWYWWSDADAVYMPSNLNNLFSGYKGEDIDLSEFLFLPNIVAYRMFADCINLTEVDFGNNILSFASSFRALRDVFSDCTSLVEVDLSGFETSKVTETAYMFDGCTSLERIYVSNLWNMENVTYSTNMFRSATKLPNFSWDYTDKTKAHTDETQGGYLLQKDAPSTIFASNDRRNLLISNQGLNIYRINSNPFRFNSRTDSLQGLTKISDGVYEFELKGNTSITISELPAGTIYRVYEETPDGWVLIDQSGENGVIKPLETSEATFDNQYNSDKISVQFTGKKTLDGKAADGFEFELVENDDVKQTKTCTNGMIQFGPIEYNTAGEHRYTIREKAGNDATITYDEHKETITVKITDNGDGTLSKEVIYNTGDILFENETKEEFLYGSLTINKETDITKEDTFSFQINFTKLNGMPYAEEVTYSVNDVEKTITPENGIIKIEGIKGGDVIKFDKLAKDVKYVVNEVDLPGGWSLDSSSGDISGTISGNDEYTATFKNKYEASGEIRLQAHKRFDGDTLADGQFMFILLDEDDNELDQQANGALDNNPKILNDNDQSEDNPWYKTGLVEFDAIKYTIEDAGKTFTYKIKEIIPTDTGIIIYDEHEETVTVEVSDMGGGILKAVATYDNDEALFVNSVKPGKLALRKEISNYTQAAENTEFTFTITLNDEQGNELDLSYDYIKYTLEEAPVMGIDENGDEYDTGETEMVEVTVDGTIKSGETLTLKAYEHIEIVGLPHGATYVIEEADVAGWELSEADNAEGTIEADITKEVTFKNVYTTEGSVIFEANKTLIGRDIIPNTYKFIVEDTNGQVVDFAYANADGSITFGGIDYTIEDDGKTFFYYIKEEMGNEEDISYDASVKEVKVNVNDNGEGQLICDISYDESGMEFINEVSYSLNVDKDVVGNKADPNRKFKFTLDLQGLGERKITYKRMEGNFVMASGIIEDYQLPYKFTLSSKETMVFSKLPTDVKYTLVEEKDDYYTAEQYEKSGKIDGENVKELFVNEINWFEVEFDKVSVDDVMISGAKLAIYQEDELYEEWITDGNSYQTKLLPGDYVLKEENVSDEDMYILAQDIPFTVNIDGSIEYNKELYEKAKVTMVDEYTKTRVLVEKIWEDNGNQDRIRPNKITVELYGDDELIDTKDILGTSDWRVEFINLPKYKKEKEISYTIKEIDVEGYTSEIKGNQKDGYKITNTHTPDEPNDIIPDRQRHSVPNTAVK